MKSFAMLALLVLLPASATFAQDATVDASADQPATREDIQRYLDTMHAKEMMTKTIETMFSQIRQTTHDRVMKDGSLPPDAEIQIDKMLNQTLKNLPIDDLVQAMVPVYQQHLTKGDVDALTAFYSTPRGQKILAELPAISAEAMKASSGIVQKMVATQMQQVQEQVAQWQRDAQSSAYQRSHN